MRFTVCSVNIVLAKEFESLRARQIYNGLDRKGLAHFSL